MAHFSKYKCVDPVNGVYKKGDKYLSFERMGPVTPVAFKMFRAQMGADFKFINSEFISGLVFGDKFYNLKKR